MVHINEIDIMYLNHISKNLEKETDEYMRKYWINHLNDYIKIFEKKLLCSYQPTQ